MDDEEFTEVEDNHMIHVDPLLRKRQDDWENLLCDPDPPTSSSADTNQVRVKNDLKMNIIRLQRIKELSPVMQGKIAYVWLYDAIHGRRIEYPLNAASLYRLKLVRSRTLLFCMTAVVVLQMIGPLTQTPSCSVSDYSATRVIIQEGRYLSKFFLTVLDLIFVTIYFCDIALTFSADTRLRGDISKFLHSKALVDMNPANPGYASGRYSSSNLSLIHI